MLALGPPGLATVCYLYETGELVAQSETSELVAQSLMQLTDSYSSSAAA